MDNIIWIKNTNMFLLFLLLDMSFSKLHCTLGCPFCQQNHIHCMKLRGELNFDLFFFDKKKEVKFGYGFKFKGYSLVNVLKEHCTNTILYALSRFSLRSLVLASAFDLCSCSCKISRKSGSSNVEISYHVLCTAVG